MYYVLYFTVWLALLFFMSGCCSEGGPMTPRAASRRILRYLAYGRITVAVAVILGFVEFFTSVTGTKESARIAFALPNDSPFAFLVYAILHADAQHVLDNVTSLLICGPLVERRMGPGWYAAFLALSALIGGYLLHTVASTFMVSRWDDGILAIGFSITGYALLASCIYWVALCAWEGDTLRQTLTFASRWFAEGPLDIPSNPIKWTLDAHQVLALTALVLILLVALFDGSPLTLTGHRIGIMLGLVLATYYVMKRYASRNGNS